MYQSYCDEKLCDEQNFFVMVHFVDHNQESGMSIYKLVYDIMEPIDKIFMTRNCMYQLELKVKRKNPRKFGT
jgi:hypothetical protein